MTSPSLSIARFLAQPQGDQRTRKSSTRIVPFASGRLGTLQMCFYAALVAACPAALRAQTVSFAGAQSTIPASGLRVPQAITYDAAGDLFIADLWDTSVIKIPANGPQTSVGSGLSFPGSVAVDSAGDVFIADTGNNRVVKVTAAGAQSTVGSGFSSPSGVAVDWLGNVFVTDMFHNRLVEISASGVQTTLSGDFSDPCGVAVDGSGNVFVADMLNNRIRKFVLSTGVESTVVSGLNQPTGVAVDGLENLYIADSANNSILKVTPANAQSVIGSGYFFPEGVAADNSGNVFIADSNNGRVVQVQTLSVNFGRTDICAVATPCSETLTLNYNVTGGTGLPRFTITPGKEFSGKQSGSCTQTASNAAFCSMNVTFKPLWPGVRAAAISFPNSPSTGIYGVGVGPQLAYAPGVVSSSALPGNRNYIQGYAEDAAGDLFIASYSNGNGSVTELLAGGGSKVFNNLGPGQLQCIAADAAGDLFVGFPSLVLEFPAAGGSPTMVKISTQPFNPLSMALDAAGDLFIADTAVNHSHSRVLEVPANQAATMVLASGFQNVTAVAVGGSGTVFALDREAQQIVEIKPGGGASVYVSNVPYPVLMAADAAGDLLVTSQEGLLEYPVGGGWQTLWPTTQSDSPFFVAVDGFGNIQFTDIQNNLYNINRSATLPLAFGSQTVKTGNSSPQSFLLQNIGNATLAVSGLTVSANFNQVPGASTFPGCSAGTTLGEGTSCDVSISFDPQVVGSITGTVSLSDTSLGGNPARQNIGLSGTGVNPPSGPGGCAVGQSPRSGGNNPDCNVQ